MELDGKYRSRLARLAGDIDNLAFRAENDTEREMLTALADWVFEFASGNLDKVAHLLPGPSERESVVAKP